MDVGVVEDGRADRARLGDEGDIAVVVVTAIHFADGMGGGHNASQYAAYGYGAGQTLEAAVRLAGSLDKDAVRTQLREMIFRSLLGRYRVDETGKQIAKSVYVMQWLDGQRRLVLPKDLRERPIQYPFKPWSER